MTIEKIYIRSFGKLKDFSCDFSDGLNIIEGKNESGKSTIAMFIKFMFYGLSGRDTKEEISEKKKYINWDSQEASGSLTFRDKSGEYRIERTILKSKKTNDEEILIYNAKTNDLLYKNENPAELFIKLSEEAFVSTSFVKQLSPTKINEQDAKQAIENILSSADESINSKKAISNLDQMRITLLHANGKGGEIFNLQSKISEVSDQLQKAQIGEATLIRAETEMSQAVSDLAKFTDELNECNEICSYHKTIVTKKAFDRKNKYIEDLNDVEEEIKQYSTSPATSEYYKDMINASNIITRSKKDIKYYSGEVNILESDLSQYEDIELDENYENNEASKKVITFHNIVKITRITSIVFTALAFLAFVIGNFVIKLPFNISLAASIGGLVLALISLTICIIAKIILTKTIGKYTNVDEAIEVLAKRIKEKATTLKTLDDYKNKLVIAQNDLKYATQKLNDLCHGIIEFSGDLNAQIYDEAIKTCVEIANTKEKLIETRASLKGRLEELERSLAKYNYDDLIVAYKNIVNTYNGRKAEALSDEEYETLKTRRNMYEERLKQQEAKLQEMKETVTILKAQIPNSSNLASELDSYKEQLKEDEILYKAYVMAMEAISESTQNIQKQVIPNIASESSALISKISSEKYNDVTINNDLILSFTDKGLTHEIDYLSAGTRDVAYLSLRIALAKALFRDENAFAIFDESFARIDETRLNTLLSTLSLSSNFQSLVFSCRSLEGQISNNLKNVKKINL